MTLTVEEFAIRLINLYRLNRFVHMDRLLEILSPELRAALTDGDQSVWVINALRKERSEREGALAECYFGLKPNWRNRQSADFRRLWRTATATLESEGFDEANKFALEQATLIGQIEFLTQLLRRFPEQSVVPQDA